MVGRWWTDKHRANMTGKKRSAQTKANTIKKKSAKHRASITEKKRSAKARANMSATRMGEK